ncbi:ABC transporter permease [Nocardiopsis listeri]|uniref:ABC transporter permease n=1 Tax=Nocardiopsis listeri TaxID=53440 RepID=UPI0008363382|nr:ABC transporter permease [Nocardiopsis listeri]
MSKLPRPDMTMSGPVVAAIAVVLGAGVTAGLDLALLWWVAVIIGVVVAFGFVAWAAPLIPDERGAGSGGATEEGTALHKTLVVPTALLLAVVSGLLSAWLLDLQLQEWAAALLGGAIGAALAFLLFHRLSAMLALSFAAVFAAGILAIAVTAAVLYFSGITPLATFERMLEYGTRPNSMVQIINDGVTYYLAAVAVAIGFKMKLFNIGVDGQYRLAALLAAAVGGYLVLPPVISQFVVIVTAVAVGGVWAGIAGYLKVARGVSEVISTIMLNSIATGITAYLLTEGRLAVEISTNNIGTPPIPESGWVPGIPATFLGSEREIFGLIFLAVAVGIGYWIMLNRTRFGFELRATGQSKTAAEASGVDVKKMVFLSMLFSGMVAGLVGLPQLLGSSHYYALDFPTGIGFIGIAIALLGRNHPVGIVFASLFWAFLNQAAGILPFDGIPQEIAVIAQATIVLTVVVVYEVVHRWGRRYEQQQIGRQLGQTTETTPEPAAVSHGPEHGSDEGDDSVPGRSKEDGTDDKSGGEAQ